MSLERLFLHEKTVKIMLKILEAEEGGYTVYPLSLSRDVKSPYSYISKVLSEFEKNGLIESEIKGRIRIIKFTDTGRRIAKILKELKNELQKDFISRKKIETLKKFIKDLSTEVKDHDEAFKAFIPIKAELELIKKETSDLELIKIAEKLERDVDCILKEFNVHV